MFPDRVRGSAIGWLGQMFALGPIIGTVQRTVLPEVEHGQQLEAVAV